jgi:purine-nucleoside phosphorylase
VEGARIIREVFGEEEFDVAVVGGSGITFSQEGKELSYSQIPGMPLPSVPGHHGVLKFFKIGNKKLLFFEGRFHYYEGREEWELRFIPKLCNELSVKIFIPTCSSGAVSRRAAQGEVGVIYDHVNLTGRNPLVGLVKEAGERVFVNGKEFYDRKLVELFLKKALELGIRAVPSVLAATLGPSYESFAEVKLLELIGVDCVSMSTVPEVIASSFYRMRTVALTIFTNDALNPKASHQEVLEVARRRSEKLSLLLEEGIREVKLGPVSP